MLVHTDMASPHLVNAGTAAQKARFIPPILAADEQFVLDLAAKGLTVDDLHPVGERRQAAAERATLVVDMRGERRLQAQIDEIDRQIADAMRRVFGEYKEAVVI